MRTLTDHRPPACPPIKCTRHSMTEYKRNHKTDQGSPRDRKVGTLSNTATRAGLILTAAAALMIGALVPTTAAWAHEDLVSSSPSAGEVLATAPSIVELTFSEPPLEGAKSEIKVTGPDGASVTAGDTTVSAADISVAIDADKDGAYQVVWQTTTDDGHTISDTFAFGVGVGTRLEDSDAASAGQDRSEIDSVLLISVVLGVAFLAIIFVVVIALVRRRGA